jgi:hypothetical protein
MKNKEAWKKAEEETRRKTMVVALMLDEDQSYQLVEEWRDIGPPLENYFLQVRISFVEWLDVVNICWTYMILCMLNN